MNIKGLFNDYEQKTKDYFSAHKARKDTIIAIVEELQKEKGYVMFDMNTTYPPFFDECTGNTEPISGARVKNGILEFIGQDYEFDDWTDDRNWFDPDNYGTYDFSEFVSALELYERGTRNVTKYGRRWQILKEFNRTPDYWRVMSNDDGELWMNNVEGCAIFFEKDGTILHSWI